MTQISIVGTRWLANSSTQAPTVAFEQARHGATVM
jgi:hypothetical protein